MYDSWTADDYLVPTYTPSLPPPTAASSNPSRRRITPAQRHEREAAESERRVHLSMLLLAASAATHLGHHAQHLLPHGFLSLGALGSLPAGWFDWLQAGLATAALAGPGAMLLTPFLLVPDRATKKMIKSV